MWYYILALGFNFIFLDKEVPVLTAYEKDGLKIIFSLNKAIDSNVLAINVVATNETLSSIITDFLFQAAVPKVSSMSLKLTTCLS